MELFSWGGGSEYRAVYTVLLGASALVAWGLPYRPRASGQAGELGDPESLAVLSGGKMAYADAVMADLLARGGIVSGEDGLLFVADPNLSIGPAGRALLALRRPFTRCDANRLLAIHAHRIAVGLVRAGLMLRSEQVLRIRWLSVAPFLMLLLGGFLCEPTAIARDGQGEVFEWLLLLTVLLAAVRFVRVDRRTTAGIEILREMRIRNAHLRDRPPAAEAGLAVALFGSSVLDGTPWEPRHRMRWKGGAERISVRAVAGRAFRA